MESDTRADKICKGDAAGRSLSSQVVLERLRFRVSV